MLSFRALARFCFAVALVLLATGAARSETTQTPGPKHKAHASAHPSSSSVEIINGGSRVTQSFDRHQPVMLKSDSIGKRRFRPEYGATQTGRSGPSATLRPEVAPSNGVVIFNGNQKETRVFDAASNNGPVKNLPPVVIGIAAAGSKNRSTQPVVVGISSSAQTTKPVVVNIASAGSNAQPVVVGIVSSGFQSVGPVAPVAVGVSPRPAKRPPYRPAALDAQ